VFIAELLRRASCIVSLEEILKLEPEENQQEAA